MITRRIMLRPPFSGFRVTGSGRLWAFECPENKICGAASVHLCRFPVSPFTYRGMMKGSRASSLWQLGLAASLLGCISVISSAENHIHLRGAEDHRRPQRMGFVPAQASLSFTSSLKSTCSFNLRGPFAANNGRFLLRSAPSESMLCFPNKNFRIHDFIG